MLPFDPFAVLSALFLAVSGSAGFGSLVTMLIQLGKLTGWKIFADETAQNWRVGLILVFVLILFFAPIVNPDTNWTFDYLNALMKSFSEFGLLVMPLFVYVANWVAKGMYKNVLRGVAVIGRSHTLSSKG